MSGSRNSGLGEKRRFIALITAVITLGFVASSLIAFISARESVRAAIEQEALPAAEDSIYAQIRTDLVKPVFVSSAMAHDTFLHDWTSGGEKNLPEIEAYLGEIAKRNQALTAFFVSDKTGRYYYANGILKTVREDEPRDVWYYRVRSLKQDYELNVDIDMAHGDQLTIFVNYRVIDRNGKFLGVAGIGLSVATIREMTERYHGQFGVSIFFTDASGKLLTGAPVEGLATRLSTLADDPNLDRAAQPVLKNHGGSFRYADKGEEVLARGLWLPELSWMVFVEKPEGEAVIMAKRALWVNLGLYLLVLALALLVSALTIDRFQSKLERSASHDPLTGAFNRLAFDAMAQQCIKAVIRSRGCLSVIMFDIDNFKLINDEFGHPAGDAVLKRVVECAQNALRGSDLFCRWGGEEFLILLPDCDAQALSATAEKLRQAIVQGTRNGCPKEVTISAGALAIALSGNQNQDAASLFDLLVKSADLSLLSAKRGGKNRVVIGNLGEESL